MLLVAQGMEALHDFLQQHPGQNIDPFLAGANDRLRTYFYEVQRSLPPCPGPLFVLPNRLRISRSHVLT